MAITKKVITQSEEMAKFIEDSGFFSSVEYDTAAQSIICKDKDGNIVFSIILDSSGHSTWNAYADATNRVFQTMPINCTAYSTAKGLFFADTNSGNGAACVVSKTNNGAYCVLLPSEKRTVDQAGLLVAGWQKVIAWGDSKPFDNFVWAGVVSLTNTVPVDNQTILLPIATHAAWGETSIFADAYFMPISQYRTSGVIIIEGEKYVTDGFVCLKDE